MLGFDGQEKRKKYRISHIFLFLAVVFKHKVKYLGSHLCYVLCKAAMQRAKKKKENKTSIDSTSGETKRLQILILDSFFSFF